MPYIPRSESPFPDHRPSIRSLSFDWPAEFPDEVESKSGLLWRAFTALDGAGELREELRAAGVNEQRIAILYPTSFHALLPALTQAVSSQSLPPARGDDWRFLHKQILKVKNELGQPMRNEMFNEELAFMRSQQYVDLAQALENTMPSDEREQADSMAVNLWRSCWQMANIERLDAAKKVRACFGGVIEWVLPQMWRQAGEGR